MVWVRLLRINLYSVASGHSQGRWGDALCVCHVPCAGPHQYGALNACTVPVLYGAHPSACAIHMVVHRVNGILAHVGRLLPLGVDHNGHILPVLARCLPVNRDVLRVPRQPLSRLLHHRLGLMTGRLLTGPFERSCQALKVLPQRVLILVLFLARRALVPSALHPSCYAHQPFLHLVV